MTSINKDTLVFGSFAKVAGNKGCEFHNAMFRKLGMNAIYKSFAVENIEDALRAMKILNIVGVGITMPFKIEALKYVDVVDNPVKEICATNTIINSCGILKAYNTDWEAARDYLQEHHDDAMTLCILGNGGYAHAVRFAALGLGMYVSTITREHWHDVLQLRECLVFNCTPIEGIKLHDSVELIDCWVSSESGQELARRQAEYQSKLYVQGYCDAY